MSLNKVSLLRIRNLLEQPSSAGLVFKPQTQNASSIIKIEIYQKLVWHFSNSNLLPRAESDSC